MSVQNIIDFFKNVTFIQGFVSSILATTVVGIVVFSWRRLKGKRELHTTPNQIAIKREPDSISQPEIGWAEIDKALDDLIVYEEGFRFQRLAISLAKKRWPQIIATEVHKDGGEDALNYPYLTKDGKRFDVACSITDNYVKIKGDAEKISSRGKVLDFLVFYTPQKVANVPIVQTWQKQFKSDFGSELVVISREDIVQELLKPENNWICREFLGLPIPSSPDIDNVLAKGLGAASRIIEQWSRQIRSDPNRLIDIEALSIDGQGRPMGQCLIPQGIAQQVAGCRRVVLRGSPGAGKTTTLIQIAQLLVKNHNKVPFLISLPDWAESQDDLPAFISKHPVAVAAGISPCDIALLHEHGHLTFLLNGWNEVDPRILASVGRQLLRADREFTAAGIVVASREHHVTPPLLSSLNLVLQSLNDTQRRSYIKSAVPKESDELIGKIETSKTLDSITRTPLFLSEIVQIYKSGAQIPDTKYGILQSAITHVEQNPEHSTSLQGEPLSGRATECLSALAFAMTKSGHVGMHYEQALSVINEVNQRLLIEGQIATKPEPKSMVNTLRAHHLLENSTYPVNTIHFVHQQFQEFYAATRLTDELAKLCVHKDENAIRSFRKDVINIPVWEESLKLLAEEISELITEKSNVTHYEVDALVAGRQLARWAIPVDPVFAAELVGILGEAAWNEVKGEFGPLLRKWYEYENEDHKECALAAMFATGTADFSDIIWPLLEHPDQQVRLSSYRASKTSYLSSLGPSWKERICGWVEDRRAEFLNELSLHGQSYPLEVFEDFARNDPSPRVRAIAINAIDWCGRRDKMWQVLRESNNETFKLVVQHQFLLRKIPDDLLPRLKAIHQQLLSETENPNERIRILLRISGIDKSESVNLLKTELENYPTENISSPNTITLYDAIAKIAPEIPDWASEWVVRKQAEGKLCDEHWSVFITKVPNEIIDQVIQEVLKSDCQDRRVYDVKYLINKGATNKHAQAIIQTLIEIHCQIVEAEGRCLKDKSEMYHRLKETARAMAWQTMTEAFLEGYSEPENNSSMEVILDLVGLGALERNETIPEIKPDDLDRLRTTLRGYSKHVLAANDYSGKMKADLSCALGFFGEVKDMVLIRKLIDADIKRIRQGREFFHQGIRVQGFGTSWSNWHVKALCRLDPNHADNYLFDLLGEPDYEEEAGLGLMRLLKRNIPQKEFSWGHKPLKIGAAIQERDYISATKSRQYSSAIEKRIRDLIAEGKKDGKPGWVGRLIITLASIGEPDAVPLILEVLQVHSEYGAWTKIDTLEALIKNGYRLDTGVVELILDQVISQIRRCNYTNQNEFLFARCLSILACTSDIPRAIARIKQLISNYRLGYEMREVIKTLGYTGSLEAGNFLIELAQNPVICKMLAHELFQALACIDTIESKNAFLSTVDSRIGRPRLHLPSNDHVVNTVATAIADWCRNDGQLKNRVFELCGETLTASQREVLANVILELSTTQAVLAGLKLISDQSVNPVPFFLREAIERSVTEHVPSEDIPNAYNIRPRENTTIRSKLFDMVYDDSTRSGSAFNLLGLIARLRLEHGNPPMEPRHPNIERKDPWPLLVS
jgi:hypothetical protein